MEDNSHLILTLSEKKFLLKILNLILDESRTKPENPIIESILSKLKSKDEIALYID